VVTEVGLAVESTDVAFGLSKSPAERVAAVEEFVSILNARSVR
jgi:hypothetical protein